MKPSDDIAVRTEQLLTAKYAAYYRLAYSYLQCEADALDAVQESACKAIRDCRQVKNPDYLETWLYRIVINTALDMLRRRKREQVLEELPEITVEDRYSEVDLKASLGQLDEKSRTVIMLRYFEDRKLEEIAEITEENVNTVKARLYRSLKKLRVQMRV